MAKDVYVKKKYDFISENLDRYIQDLLLSMSPAQWAMVPTDIAAKVKRRSDIRATRLTFGEKVYLATVVNGISAVLLFSSKSGDDLTLNIDSLKDALKVKGRKIPLAELAESLYNNQMFAIGDSELMEAVSFVRMAAVSKLWKTTIPAARRINISPTQYDRHRIAYRSVMDMFTRYDAGRRRIHIEYGLNHAEWAALLYFLRGEDKANSFFSYFKHAQGTRLTSMQKAMTRLNREGYLKSRGKASQTVHSITAKGEHVVMTIFEKIIL